MTTLPKDKHSELSLKCKTCGITYQKPDYFKAWNESHPNVFFQWNLSYCDECRQKKEGDALKLLPEVINALTNNTP